jgi:hypothetical protein
MSALRTGRPYPQENIPGAHFYKGLSRTQDYVNKKIPIKPSGIETATFRLVALTRASAMYWVANVNYWRPQSASIL